MKDKHKLWMTVMLLVVIAILIISTLIKITPDKVSKLMPEQTSQKANQNNGSVEMIHGEDSSKGKRGPNNFEEQVEADEEINTQA